MIPNFTPEPRPYLLKNKIQHYAWGTKGEEAFIPRFLGIEPEETVPYAELWIGTHPKAPSEVLLDGTSISLRAFISQNPQALLGEAVSERFSGDLPFLFKVLSIGAALSIQVHPSKEQARALHARDPEHYPDENHKPELAIALDSLTALVGFKSLAAMRQTLDRYPELANFIGQDVQRTLSDTSAPSPSEQRDLVRLIYSTLVTRSIEHPEELLASLSRLGERLQESTDTLREEERYFLDLREQYGADVGLFSIFLLNLVHLERGEAIFTAAGIPHAYLKGTIVECMANSDNVVRVGLTPKYKDAETLIGILDYEPKPVPVIDADLDFGPTSYRTPNPEFQVNWWRLRPGQERRESTEGKLKVYLIAKGEILVRWSGRSESREETFAQGQSFFIPALLEQFEVRAQDQVDLFEVEVPL